jgi:hypothetical protein
MSAPDKLLTLGQIARRYGCQLWQVRRLYERRLLPEPQRVSTYRVLTEADVPLVEAALRKAGYLGRQGGAL